PVLGCLRISNPARPARSRSGRTGSLRDGEQFHSIAGKLGQGEQIGSEQLNGIMEFLSIFVDKCHHGKEEEFLFPALEAAGVPRDVDLIGVMLNEHEQGRKLVAKLKDAVTRYTSGDKTAAAGFQHTTSEYVTLLTQHIEKENNVLFAMADAKLDAAKDAELFEAFEQLENERIGPGKHEEFHELLNRLKHEYLG
ncbi:MAG: hemerythrin domain-containing protein, partial [Bacteroidales bacterium]